MKKLTTLLALCLTFAFASTAQSIITVDSARVNDGNGVPVDSGLRVQLTGVAYGPDAYPTHNGHQFMLRGTNLSIKVYSKGNFQYNFTEGDSVTVIGTLSTYHGDAEMDLKYTTPGDTIIRLGTGTQVAPLVVTITDLNATITGEQYESSLVQVNNVDMNMIQGWPGTHANHSFSSAHVGNLYFFIDSFMSPDLWNLSSAPAGQYNIVGFGSQYDPSYAYTSGYSLQPRSLADFHQLNVGIGTIASNLTAAVYPNPASTRLTVTFTAGTDDNYTSTITDVTGRVVISQEGNVFGGDNNVEFNTASLSNGMYILTLNTGGKTLINKINISK
ncbi:MAG: hypothetical protein JWO03_3210 [Bacteroidetes bacterium]|nr:hypothetical protein [Bacteroidota bacterium]